MMMAQAVRHAVTPSMTNSLDSMRRIENWRPPRCVYRWIVAMTKSIAPRSTSVTLSVHMKMTRAESNGPVSMVPNHMLVNSFASEYLSAWKVSVLKVTSSLQTILATSLVTFPLHSMMLWVKESSWCGSTESSTAMMAHNVTWMAMFRRRLPSNMMFTVAPIWAYPANNDASQTDSWNEYFAEVWLAKVSASRCTSDDSRLPLCNEAIWGGSATVSKSSIVKRPRVFRPDALNIDRWHLEAKRSRLQRVDGAPCASGGSTNFFTFGLGGGAPWPSDCGDGSPSEAPLSPDSGGAGLARSCGPSQQEGEEDSSEPTPERATRSSAIDALRSSIANQAAEDCSSTVTTRPPRSCNSPAAAPA
mmetsp:Transcript_67707/g.195713  ORF Transcript_67707/g.195713 Transcript_67707/m.195713 type:complete len:360 (-) Transcript_67707:530-1609(-)